MSNTLQDQVVQAISAALKSTQERGALALSTLPVPFLEPPKRPEWGDLSSNVAMTLASQAKKPPIKIAEILAEELREGSADLFQRIDVAPPGFLNLTLHPLLWVKVLQTIEEDGSAYGRHRFGVGKSILLEFVSANPTGPLHVGHGRGAAIGQAMASLLQAVGYEVTREYYINDAGRQLRLLGQSVFARYREKCGESPEFPEDGYHGGYIADLADSLFQSKGKDLLEGSVDEAEQHCAQFACTILLSRIREDLHAFGVGFENWFSETRLHKDGLIKEALDDLTQRTLVGEEEGAWWFRSSQFGDEKDRVVQKQDGSYTYLAADIAYHREKLSRGFDTLINIWGADHHGYIPRMHAAVQAFGYDKEALRVVLVQMVSLLRRGKKIEMSKRAGEFVTLRDVLKEVGPDAAKFFFIMRRADTHLDFDLELAKEQSSDNPVYYVQYAHARLASLFRVAQERQIPIPSIQEVEHGLLVEGDELGLIKRLAQYPNVVAGSASALEPHRLTFYLQELAAQLHAYYNKHRILPPLGPSDPSFHDPLPSEGGPGGEALSSQEEVPRDEVTPELTSARLALLRQVQTVIKNGLELVGVSAPEKM